MKHRVVRESYLAALEAAADDLEIMSQCLQDVSDEAEEAGSPPQFVLERQQIEETLRAIYREKPVFPADGIKLAPWHLRLRARLFGRACVDYLGEAFAFWYRGELVVVRDPVGGADHE